MLAKEVATLDCLNGGRIELGIGVGWLKEEFEALGIPFERRGKRAAPIRFGLLRVCIGPDDFLAKAGQCRFEIRHAALYRHGERTAALSVLIDEAGQISPSLLLARGGQSGADAGRLLSDVCNGLCRRNYAANVRYAASTARA